MASYVAWQHGSPDFKYNYLAWLQNAGKWSRLFTIFLAYQSERRVLCKKCRNNGSKGPKQIIYINYVLNFVIIMLKGAPYPRLNDPHNVV